MKHPEAVLDFGSAKVVAMLGGMANDGRLEVYGLGCGAHKGLRKRSFLDLAELKAAVSIALDEAQSEARRSIRRVFVGVPGPFIETFCRRGEAIFDMPHKVEPEDVERLIAASLSSGETPTGCLHQLSVPVNYKLDGVMKYDTPVGQTCEQLSAVVSHVYMREEFKSIIEGILDEMDVKVNGYIDSLIAEALLLIPERRQEADSIVVDIGYYHTDVCIVRNEAPIYHKVLPVGGAHLAKDISYVLGMSEDMAEAVKRRHVFGLDYSDRVDSYKLSDGSSEEHEYETLQAILETRALEMVDMIIETILDGPIDIEPDIPIYLCGGGIAMMRGGREFFQSHVDLPVSTEMPTMPRRNSANFLSAYGVLQYALNLTRPASGQDWKEKPIIQSLINFFTK